MHRSQECKSQMFSCDQYLSLSINQRRLIYIRRLNSTTSSSFGTTCKAECEPGPNHPTSAFSLTNALGVNRCKSLQSKPCGKPSKRTKVCYSAISMPVVLKQDVIRTLQLSTYIWPHIIHSCDVD